MNEIVKYTTSYTIHFNKELELEPVQLGEQAFKKIEQALKTEQFVDIWWTIHNKFNILYIKPIQIEEEILHLLNQQPERIREEVKKEIKLYKNKITPWVVQNMIDKYK